MGKKGKRSKKEDAKKAAHKIIRESDTLMQGAIKDYKDHMYSKSANESREAIRLLESKKELMEYTSYEHLLAFYILMTLEYKRRNYNAALDCYNDIMSKSRHISSLRDAALLYYQLLMLRLNGQECQLSNFIHHIPRDGKTATIICFEATLAFRAHKMYDSAIQLEMTCGRLLWNPLESKLSLALTYLEQYRVEYHQRSQMREEDFSTMRSLIVSIQEDYVEFGMRNGFILRSFSSSFRSFASLYFLWAL
ncbi:predicted protein [Chaetoceros tenuissimus]|uniref:Uncharacterized protein n=1 Tax=Chaetoceros tenuissimus TaxID=426638 RepID=A0AAD3H8F7_9STRA|nr:predicted protein [Chaetoceros tenuissimus]